MANNTKIQWTDATWNVAVGCSKVSPGCKYCYMMRDFDGRYGRSEVNGTVTRTKPGTFNAPLNWQKKGLTAPDGNKLKVFTSSLTDIFHEQIDSYRNEIWDIIRACPDLIFQILTKRPERIVNCLPQDWGEGWPNVWFGTSIESQDQVNRALELWKFPAAVRFLSVEPLIGAVDLSGKVGLIDWVIVGGESGNDSGKYLYRECRTEWIDNVISYCRSRFVPVFMKQTGTALSKQFGYQDRNGGNLEEWPLSWQIRQFPRQYDNQTARELWG